MNPQSLNQNFEERKHTQTIDAHSRRLSSLSCALTVSQVLKPTKQHMNMNIQQQYQQKKVASALGVGDTSMYKYSTRLKRYRYNRP